MPHNEASDLGLYSLPMTLLWVSRYKWVNLDLSDGLFISIITHLIAELHKADLDVWVLLQARKCVYVCVYGGWGWGGE